MNVNLENIYELSTLIEDVDYAKKYNHVNFVHIILTLTLLFFLRTKLETIEMLTYQTHLAKIFIFIHGLESLWVQHSALMKH